ncbi:MAG: response regulator [Desulfuromonadales bacterium]
MKKEKGIMYKKILMAEDSASVRMLMTKALAGAGYDVIEARDGEEALEHMRSAPFDMLITDLNMPRMDGINLIRTVRQIDGNRFLPIIMLTSEGDEASRQRGRKAGASSWIVKPFKSEQLLQLVRTVLV